MAFNDKEELVGMTTDGNIGIWQPVAQTGIGSNLPADSSL